MTASIETTPVKRRVALVVDDEKVIATTLAVILNNAGFEAHALFSGQDAVDALETLQPDLLISDVVMPGMTGIEAAIITRRRVAKVQNSALLRSGRHCRFAGDCSFSGSRIRASHQTSSSDRFVGKVTRMTLRTEQLGNVASMAKTTPQSG